MLICRVSDDDVSSTGKNEIVSADDHSHEFQTANELFDLMAKNHNFQPSADEALTTRDLVILYKNIDLGTKLMSSANDFKRKTPNQYVETVVYNEDRESDSDISEICSSEDLHNVILINKERIELLNNPPSLENSICHKFGDFDLQTSDLDIDYDRQFVFKDPYIKEQLKNLNLISGGNEFEGSVLPVSFLDYICCKRLEDNYNFYMDNIIRYVQHTIDQLKRISNGDYLTDKAKEKWREVEKDAKDSQDADSTKILAKCTSIPLHVERKNTGNSTTWDDIVHSEVDVRYLSKILEKRIVVEIPKTISSPYKLFSKCCAGNLVISCKKETRPNFPGEGEKESRVDVVFKLERSECGQVMSNINSIMILPNHKLEEEGTASKILPLAYEVQENVAAENSLVNENEICHVLELENYNNDVNNELDEHHSFINCKNVLFDINNEPGYDEAGPSAETIVDYEDVTTVPMVDIRDMVSRKRSRCPEASFNIIPGDELRLTMQRLNIQSSLPEECLEDMPTHAKRKSPTRNRVKSPYQNNSYFLEEKKRKKLLEIRERREKKKMAMTENCKVNKTKYGKNAIMPVTSSSVTKLSITNKSFYNSIYGQSFSTNTEQPKQSKVKERKDSKRDIVIRVPSEHSVTEEKMEISKESSPPTSISQKYVDRNYFFDDTVTEMMYLKMKRGQNENTISDSTSVSQLMNPSTTNIKAKVSFTTQENLKRLDKIISEMDQTELNARDLITTRSNTIMLVPANTPKDSVDGAKRSSTSNTSIQFRKSIDKIYELMEKLGKTEDIEFKLTKSKFTARLNDEQRLCATGALDGSTGQCSDSGTSVKHHILSSTPSYTSFDKYKTCNDDNKDYYCIDRQSSESKNSKETAVIVPKVIINNKISNPEKYKSYRKNQTDHSPIQVNDNPLKAISQLLHDIDNVQKTRQKTNTEVRSSKKREPQKPADIKINVRPTYKKPAKIEQKLNVKPKLNQGDHIKNPLLDIVDEYKEARGEAVRGPSKINSRLNSLAQPKKSYVQAHMEEYQTRYGRNVMSDRLQKLSTGQAPPISAKPRPGVLKNKQTKLGIDAGLKTTVKQSPSPSPPLENASKYKHCVGGNNEIISIAKPQSEVSRKYDNLSVKPENIKNKMVAVESYVKNHYGRSSPTASSTRWNLTSRAPLVPNDLGYTSSMESSTNSPEQSAVIGKKLHNIIDTMVLNTQTELSCVRESNESNSKASISTENLSKEDRASIIMSDYGEYEFEQPSVQGKKQNAPCEVTTDDVHQVDAQTLFEALNNINAKKELEKLESALHRKLSAGAFHKRLRIRNFTLTPKHSLQQTVVLQSGDCNASFVVESTLSQNLKIKNCKSETLAELKTLSAASNTKINWNLNIPMQITTVGYAFPVLQKVPSSVAGFLTSRAYEKQSIAQIQDQDHRCDDKNQVQFGDFVNFSNSVNNTSATPEICKTLHRDNSDENSHIDVTGTEDVEVKQYLEGLNKNAINVKVITNNSEETETLMGKVVDSSRSIKSDNVGCSSSLDILVCLLNEIQKITNCELYSEGFENNEQSKQLMAVLNEAATLRDTVHSHISDVISISSLDKLRRLESNHSMLSFYVDKDIDKKKLGYESNIVSKVITMNSMNVNCSHNTDDKEVNVKIQEKELVHAFTDVPSRFLPVTITSGTYMSNSLIGIISEPSTQSIINLNDLQSNLLTAHKKIIEIPQHTETNVINTETNVVPTAAVPLRKTEKTPENSCVNSGKEVKIKVPRGHKKISDMNKVKRSCDSNLNGVIARKSEALGTDEQVMKIKRDVLVTLYSVLVFTVFAALSFPEMLSRV